MNLVKTDESGWQAAEHVLEYENMQNLNAAAILSAYTAKIDSDKTAAKLKELEVKLEV